MSEPKESQEPAKRMGRPPIAGKPTAPLTVMLTPEQRSKVERVSKQRQCSASAVLRLLVERLAEPT